MTCQARNTWKDSGDRGAARHEHDRAYHPDHVHVWGPTPYNWEQVHTPDIMRCTICFLAQHEDKAGECSPSVYM